MGACNCKTLQEEPDSASKVTAAAAVNGAQKHSKAPPLNHLASLNYSRHPGVNATPLGSTKPCPNKISWHLPFSPRAPLLPHI
jgi:hypothetical protein